MEELKHEHRVLAPEVLEKLDHVDRLDLAEGAPEVVYLLKRDDEAVGEATGAVDVGIRAGAYYSAQDLVLLALGDLAAAVN